MSQKRTELEAIANLAREILHHCAKLLSEEKEPKFPEEARKLVESGVCLFCGKDTYSKEWRRGCHMSCFQKLSSRMKASGKTEFEMIEEGKLAPKSNKKAKDLEADVLFASPLEARLNQKLAEKRSKKSKKPG